jgi:predicted alpha-1,6-mannanase (GH76 family)
MSMLRKFLAAACPRRGWRRVVGLGLLTLYASACSGEATGADEDMLSDSGRADAATSALVSHFWDVSQHDFREAFPLDNKGAGYWIYAEAFDAVLDAVQRTGTGSQFHKYIDLAYSGQAARGWQSDFFDDESWMAMALIRAYDVTHDGKYLGQAESLYADINQNGRTNAGVWWNRQHVEKATASNFGPAIVAARLNERTGKPEYKQDALDIYDYWYSTMVDHTTYHVADHKMPDGSVDWTSKWTYNTGLAIGASIELWKITGNQGYLSHAYAFGSYLIHDQVHASAYGNILYDASCTGDCDAFKGIAFRFLTKLYVLDRTQTQYGDVLTASVKAIWAGRNTQLDIFNADWGSNPPQQTSLAAEASAVMALNVAAENGI